MTWPKAWLQNVEFVCATTNELTSIRFDELYFEPSYGDIFDYKRNVDHPTGIQVCWRCSVCGCNHSTEKGFY